MILSKTVQVTKEYIGNSKFPFWNDISIGDTLTVRFNLTPQRRGSNGLYAGMVKVYNLTKVPTQSFEESVTNIAKYLSKLEYESILL